MGDKDEDRVSGKASIYLSKLRQNPLKAEDLTVCAARKQPTGQLLQNFLFYDSGCYLLSGQRGTGKTTMVNQLIYYLENLDQAKIRQVVEEQYGLSTGLIPSSLFAFTAWIDIVKGYDETQLLERILRQVTSKILHDYQLLPKVRQEIRRRIGSELAETLITYVRDSKELLDYRRTTSVEASVEKATALGLKVSGQFKAELNAIAAKDELAIEVAPEISRQVARTIQKNISLEAKDFTVEKLEHRLTQLLLCLAKPTSIIEISNENTSSLLSPAEIENVVREALAKKNLLDQTQESIDRLLEAVKRAWDKVLNTAGLVDTSNIRPVYDKTLVVIDDTDKGGYRDAITVLNNLRTLFQSSHAFFLFVGSEEFYEEWYSYSAPGTRSPIDSVFHNVYYVPPFSLIEARQLLELLTSEVKAPSGKQKHTLDWYAAVLLFVSQGLPRQLMRSLDLLAIKMPNGHLRLDSRFFDLFMDSNYAGLIRKFLDVYTGYRDPRYEKCLYIALMMLTSVKRIADSSLRASLESNQLTKQYSPIIHKRIVEDIEKIVPTTKESTPAYSIDSDNCVSLARTTNDSALLSVAQYLNTLRENGTRTISVHELDTHISQAGAHDRVVSIREHLESQNVILRTAPILETFIDVGDYTFVIGPREIEGINSGSFTLQGVAEEQRTGNVGWLSSARTLRRYLVES